MKKIFSILAAIAWTFSVHASLSTSNHASNNYIEEWGRLKLVGNQLCDENGERIQLKGWSTAGNFDTSCLKDTNALKQMKEWGANIVRLPQYINNKSYNSFSEEEYKRYIDATADLGMYILADWNVLKSDDCTECGNPHNFIEEGKFNTSATTFFKAIASYVKEKEYKHVLYEVCSEPAPDVTWDSIKSYAEKMIDVIYQNECAPTQTHIVIVVTPNWSQRPSDAFNNKITTDKAQVMYAFHVMDSNEFDPTSNSSKLNVYKSAIRQLPVFISEWSMSDGTTNTNRELGMDFYNATEGMYGQVVSWCNWSWSNDLDDNSAFKGSCEDAELSPFGKRVVEMLQTICCTPPPCCDPCYGGTHFEFSTKMSSEELFKVSYYKTGGEGVSYHDANDTEDENLDQPTVLGFPGCQAGVAKGYCDFRADECVDISVCNGGIDNIGEGYYVGWISKGEWLRYCINIKEPAYYYVEMVGNPTSSKKPMYISVVDKGSVTCDIDASTETKAAEIDAIYFENLPQKYYDPSAPAENELMHWGWLNSSNESGTTVKNYGICLKEAGEYDIQLSFPEGFGDMGSLRFTPVKAYTGEGWLGINDNPAAANVKIHYDASTEEVTVNAALFKMEVLDLTGKVLVSDNAQSINIANLAKGIYIVKAYTEEWGIVTNQILKR